MRQNEGWISLKEIWSPGKNHTYWVPNKVSDSQLLGALGARTSWKPKRSIKTSDLDDILFAASEVGYGLETIPLEEATDATNDK